MAEIFMTLEGKKQLEERLKDLKINGRAQAAAQIQAAREFGDLSENAEYDIAKEEQAKMEAEIAEIESKLKNVKIIDEKNKSDKVDFGSKIKIKNTKDGKEYDYTVVGSTEANPVAGRISNESPIGKAMMGKKKGEDVWVKTPSGNVLYKLVKIG